MQTRRAITPVYSAAGIPASPQNRSAVFHPTPYFQFEPLLSKNCIWTKVPSDTISDQVVQLRFPGREWRSLVHSEASYLLLLVNPCVGPSGMSAKIVSCQVTATLPGLAF